MKTIIALSALFLLYVAPAGAQTNSYTIGVVGGPSLISLHGTDVTKDHHKTAVGFVGGIWGQYHVSRRFSIVSQLAYERKGSKAIIEHFSASGEKVSETELYSYFDYITLPALARWYFGDGIRYFINAGPYTGYMLRQVNTTSEDDELPSNIKPYNRQDFGLSAGAGLLAPVAEHALLTFEIRNNFGITKLTDQELYGKGTVRTNSLNFLLGLSYAPGRW